ncbi:hypothetical protein, partial [Vogesella oryzae]|uniref:hypothetical protein n=1 Tax=Vogesella oryzae TaxID=1735285 RepID=UPI001C2EC159
ALPSLAILFFFLNAPATPKTPHPESRRKRQMFIRHTPKPVNTPKHKNRHEFDKLLIYKVEKSKKGWPRPTFLLAQQNYQDW